MSATVLTPHSTRLPGSRPAERQWWEAVLWALLLAAAAVIFMGPLWHRQPMVAVATLLLSGTLIVTGVILWGESTQRRTAGLLILTALLWPAGWVEEWGAGPLPLLASVFSPMALVVGGWAIFRYPNPDLFDRPERIFLAVLAGWLIGGQLGYDFAEPASWSQYPSGTWWITLDADRGLRDAIDNLCHLGAVPLAVVYMLLWLRRFRRVRGLDRRLLSPVAIAAPVAAVISAAVPLAQLAGAKGDVLDSLYSVETVLLACVPIAFGVTVVRRRLANTAVLALVREVQRRPTPEAVQQSLRTALDDPTLRVSYWAPDLNSYVDLGGRQVEPGAEPGNRLVVPISSSTGQPLAMIDTDLDLRRHADVVTGAASASGLALENAQLQAAVRAQLEQVRVSRLRTVEAGVAERRRLERDLHDGAQQRLLALRLALAAADNGSLQPPAKAFLRGVSQEIGVALAELRELARGIHPAVLSQAGLAAAIEAVVERQAMVVEPHLPSRRYPAATEATAYSIICESLNNAARHACASRVLIRGHEADGLLTIEVEDDGRGGAQVRAGSGLGGLVDRARALGGDMMLCSPPGAGTLVVAAIPCG